jgi:2,4-dienoyl-CoA reductase-like NADH-dependent reductase (Old Yellow Enzyme family)/thioredoxin reductase
VTGSDVLWTPGSIGGVTIRNRFVLTGHGTAMVTDGSQMVEYYAERARGGVGLIMLGTQQVHPSSPGLGHLLLNYDDGVIPRLRAIATAVRAHGARVFGYIGHFGAQANTRPDPPWSASALLDDERGEMTHAMTEAEMRAIAAAHADAAARNLEAGMDGIEVHGGHGLLLHQFLSPWTNRRTDAYGGDVANRLRFPIMVIRAVRERIGPGVPLGMRLSGDETVPGGLSVADMTVIVPLLVAAADLDFVDVSAGNDRHPISNMLHHPPMGLPVAPYAEAARAIRASLRAASLGAASLGAAGRPVPVIHGTRINSAAAAAALITSGAADFAGMCRALIADPHLPNKRRAGREADTTPCIACEQACIGHLERGQPISCIARPDTGREAIWGPPRPAERRRDVVVVGGGPAGMVAASLAAERGHRVTLLERDAMLGGLPRLAARAPGRAEWLDLVAHLERRLAASGAVVRRGAEATPADVAGLRPDAVILATGSEAAAPDLPGAAHLVSHRAVLAGAVLAGAEPGGAALARRVLILDATNHQQGVSTALYLARAGHAVTIATSGTRVGHRLERPNFTRANMLLAAAGVIQIADFAATAIVPDGAVGRHALSGADLALRPFDSVVSVMPGRPRDPDDASWADPSWTLTRIGDSRTPRDVEAAILDAHRVARAL